MATLQYETQGNTDLDRTLTRETRQIVQTALLHSPTIRELSAHLGIGYRRTRTLLRALDLRGFYRKWEKKPNDSA